ncbi:unnamed protein product [Darwinula stevensoni]|uniref:Fatty acid desaturase domain-containing protein n=1 Tax=Darwinula stevensoni TaxID=69355 RepID=A0A7R8X3H6_9CRUS|nr:unnamed protein product [Darwinula stevensoni]CAG0882359.1 unnamed protein product [Darwinula stevensoni]
MAPNTKDTDILPTGRLYEFEPLPQESSVGAPLTDKIYDKDIVWRNVILFIILHSMAPLGIYYIFARTMAATNLFFVALVLCSGFGITAGAHRLWAHRSYKAKWPLRLLLGFFNTIAFQNDIHEWSRDHRVHHKFSETDADPHNARRGFFFSHVGWLCVKKHQEVIARGKSVDCNDLLADPIVYYQRMFYLPLVLLCCFVFPTVTPVYFWGEDAWVAFCTCALARYCLVLNGTWLVNSAAHIWGPHPYDKNISAVENLSVATLAFGEGWHNYHHTFPWDYKTSELGAYHVNFTALFIDFMAFLGLAYDLKSVPDEVVKQRVLRTGDGSHYRWGGPVNDKRVKLA